MELRFECSLVELFLVVRVFNLRCSSAGMHTIPFMILNNIASLSDFLLSDSSKLLNFDQFVQNKYMFI